MFFQHHLLSRGRLLQCARTATSSKHSLHLPRVLYAAALVFQTCQISVEERALFLFIHLLISLLLSLYHYLLFNSRKLWDIFCKGNVILNTVALYHHLGEVKKPSQCTLFIISCVLQKWLNKNDKIENKEKRSKLQAFASNYYYRFLLFFKSK